MALPLQNIFPATASSTALNALSAVANAVDVGITTGSIALTVTSTEAVNIGLPTAQSTTPTVTFLSARDDAANGGVPFTPSGSLVADDRQDVIVGTDRDDVIFGGGGADTIHGGGGNDHLYGRAPSGGADAGDVIFGGDGSDYVQGNAGADTLDGGTGSDRIFGGADADLIFGRDGHDVINGNFGADTIDGGDGNDIIRGGKGEDLIFGGDGADLLSGDLGSDTLVGGAGTDVFRYSGNDASLVDTDLVAGRFETISDFEDGSDHLMLSFRPSAVLHGSADSLSGAMVQAQLLFATIGQPGMVAAVQAGTDTYLFFGYNGGLPDSSVRLLGVDGQRIGVEDFI